MNNIRNIFPLIALLLVACAPSQEPEQTPPPPPPAPLLSGVADSIYVAGAQAAVKPTDVVTVNGVDYTVSQLLAEMAKLMNKTVVIQ